MEKNGIEIMPTHYKNPPFVKSHATVTAEQALFGVTAPRIMTKTPCAKCLRATQAKICAFG